MSDRPAAACGPHPPPAADGGPPAFDPAWRTETVVALASGIVANGSFDRLPVLADALEDAGCHLAPLLAHLRHGHPHTPDCWAVALVLAHGPVLPPPPTASPPPGARRVERVLNWVAVNTDPEAPGGFLTRACCLGCVGWVGIGVALMCGLGRPPAPTAPTALPAEAPPTDPG